MIDPCDVKMAPKRREGATKKDVVKLLAQSAYNLWNATLYNAPPETMINRVFHRIREVRVGDLVLETTTYYPTLREPSIGRLVAIDHHRDHEIFVVKMVLDDDRIERWDNARFITIPEIGLDKLIRQE